MNIHSMTETIEGGRNSAADRAPGPTGPTEQEISTLALLEIENSGLRRLIVELLHKNQELRDRIRTSGERPTDVQVRMQIACIS